MVPADVASRDGGSRFGRVKPRADGIVSILRAGQSTNSSAALVPLVVEIAVAVGAAAGGVALGADGRVLLGGGVRRLGGAQAARRERRIEVPPEPRGLGRHGGQVQRRRRADRTQVAFDLVRRRGGRDGRPLLAMDLVVDHAGHRLPGRHLHPQEEIEAEARLVEQVGASVLRLGDLHLPVAERAGGVAEAGERFVLVLQHPHGEATVDDIAAIARVVPPPLASSA